jgi:autotransporter-associated beta strand protein
LHDALHRRLLLEPLEDRCLLSVGYDLSDLLVSSGQLAGGSAAAEESQSLVSASSQGSTPQVVVPTIAAMPDLAVNYQYQDWKATAAGFDRTVFDPTASYQYPLFWWDTRSINGVGGGFGMPSYVGLSAGGSGEAINTIAAVLGATLVGIDKHAQTLSDGQTYDFVIMASRYYNSQVGANMVLNGVGASSQNSFWYEQLPGILYYGLADKSYSQYAAGSAGQQRIDTVINGEAAKLHSVINVLAGGSSTAIPNFNYQGFNYVTMLPSTGTHLEPEGAAGAAWLQYMAYEHTGNTTYLADAKQAMSFLDNLSASQNPLYEDILPFGTLVAARMNAEQGTNYDVAKMVNWCFAGGSYARSTWGVNTDAQWGGYGVAGLVGEINNYPFSMNTYDWAAALTPLVRYDPRYANAIGKWMLNLSNSSRLYLKSGLPLAQQASGSWSDAPSDYYSYESLHKTYNGLTPYAGGDAGGVLEFAYGSGHVGLLGGIVSPTSVPQVLQLDLLATDFFHDANAYPSYLFYNPYSAQKMVSFDVGATPVDLYDTLSGRFIATGVSGTVTVPIAAENSLSLVYVPQGSVLNDDGTRVTVGDVVVNYRSPELNRQYWNNTLPAGGTWSATAANWSDRNGSNSAAWTGGGTAVFPGSTGAESYTVTLDGTRNIAGLWFQGDAVTLNGGALNLSSDATFSADGGTDVINSPIQGAFNVIKAGAGTIRLGTANSMTGITTIQEGTVQLAHALGLQASLVDLEVPNGLDVHGLSATLGGLAGTGDLDLGATTLTVGGGNLDTTYSGDLSGVGAALVKTGTGVLELAGSNSYTSGTSVQSGVLRFTAAGSVPASGLILIPANGYAGANAAAAGAGFNSFVARIDRANSTGTLGIESEVDSDIDLTAVNAAVRLGSSTTGTITGVLTPQGNVYRLGGGAGTLEIRSPLADGSNVRSVDVGVNGTQQPGIIVLSGANTYSGGTTISAGELSVAEEANLGASGTALTFNGGLLRVTGTQFASTVRPIIVGSGGGGFDIADLGNTFTVRQNVSGGALWKYGPGTLVLAGSNSQNGLRLGAGTLIANSAANLGSGTITLGGGSTLQLNTTQAWTLANGLALGSTGTIDVAGSGGVTFSGPFSGSGNMTLARGNLTLNGTDTYSGTTVVNGGTLTLGAAAASAGNFYVNSGTLATRSLSLANVYLGTSSPDGATAMFVLSQSGDALSRRVYFTGNANATRIAGGNNTSGTVSFTNWFNAGAGTAYYTAAAGGTVKLLNIVDGSSTSVCKIGAGTVMVTKGAANAGSASYSGNTSVRNGTLVLAENDYGTTAVNTVLPNGAINPYGKGGSLGFNAFGNAVQLGDSGTLATDNIALLTSAGQYVGHNLNVNAQNALGATTLGNSGSGAAWFAGNIALAKSVTLTAAAGGSANFTGVISGSGGVTASGGGTVVLTNNNTYTGDTTVTAGTLNLTGSVAGGVSVGPGAVLGGSGTIAGDLSVASGGVLLLGSSSHLDVGGDLAFGSSVTVALASGTLTPGSYTLLSYDGILSGSPTFVYSGPAGQSAVLDTTTPGVVTVKITSTSTLSLPSPGTITYGGALSLSATLLCGATPLPGETVLFSVHGVAVGTAVTNASGVATLSGVGSAGCGAGTNTSCLAASFAGDATYSSSSAAASLTVNPATLVVSADSHAKTYGDTFTDFTGRITGLVFGDNITANRSSPGAAADAGVAGSPYAISVVLADPGNTLGNYSVTYELGNLTVTPATLTVTAAKQSRAYGAANPTFTANYSGFVNGEDLPSSGITGSPAVTCPATSASPVGSYTITAGPGSLAGVNYRFGFVDGTLLVTAAATSTLATSSSAATISGRSVTFTATVTPVSGAGPTGTVQFQIDGIGFGSPVAISGGTASYSTAAISVGTHSVAALYSGDGNFAGSISPAVSQTVVASLDAEGNCTADALTDGILILRYLFDPTGAWNYSDALGSGAIRTKRDDVKLFLDSGRSTVLDVDGNGTPDALTDGILILRYLFDPSGQWNYSDALGSGATRTTRAAIRAYLDQYNPDLPAGSAGSSDELAASSACIDGGVSGNAVANGFASPSADNTLVDSGSITACDVDTTPDAVTPTVLDRDASSPGGASASCPIDTAAKRDCGVAARPTKLAAAYRSGALRDGNAAVDELFAEDDADWLWRACGHRLRDGRLR